MAWAILDTNIYVGHWERGAFDVQLARIRDRFIIRQSAVVLSELRRSARTKVARQRVEALLGTARALPWAPLAQDWWEAADLIRRIGDAEDWETQKRREFQNDALIALTARRQGATVVTDNRGDFELLARRVSFSLDVI